MWGLCTGHQDPEAGRARRGPQRHHLRAGTGGIGHVETGAPPGRVGEQPERERQNREHHRLDVSLHRDLQDQVDVGRDPERREERHQGDPEGPFHVGEAPPVHDQRRVHEAQRQEQDEVGEMRQRFQRQQQCEDADCAAHRDQRHDRGLRARVDPAEDAGKVPQMAHGQRHARPRQDRRIRGGDHREERAAHDHHAADRSQEGPRGDAMAASV